MAEPEAIVANTNSESEAAIEKRNQINQIYAELEGIYKNKGTIEVEINSIVKGGFKVYYKEIPLYLPFRLFKNDINTSVEEYQKYIGSKVEVAVISFDTNDSIRIINISHLKVVEDKLLQDLKVGMVVSGTVKSIIDKGIVVTLDNNLEAFIPISKISQYRLNRIEDYGIQVGDKLEPVIANITPAENNRKARITLSLEKYIPQQIQQVFESLKEGDIIKRKIKNIIDSGIFVEITPGVDGFIKRSEVSWVKYNVNLKELFEIGQEIEAEIISINPETQKIALSYRKTLPNTWKEIVDKYSMETEYTGIVTAISEKGVYVTLNDEIEGFMPISKMRALLENNKIKLNQFDMVQVKIAVKDEEKNTLIFESAIKPERREFNRTPRESNRFSNNKNNFSGSNNYSIIDILSEESKKELFNKK